MTIAYQLTQKVKDVNCLSDVIVTMKQ